MTSRTTPLRVRYAPSPTGILHLGNLRTAWVSKRWAEMLHGEWHVRFEDIDAPRSIPGVLERQLEDLAVLGMTPVKWHRQSERADRHWELFEKARESGAIYPCTCSRRTVIEALRGLASAPHGPPAVYDGHCRAGLSKIETDNPSIAWRFRAVDPSGKNDFITARTFPSVTPGRSTFTPAYHWACAIDDFDDRFDLLVRAWDLDIAIEPQWAVRDWVSQVEGMRHPAAIFHTSTVTDATGKRLEKRTAGITLPEMLAQSISAEKILRAFTISFSIDPKSFIPGKIWGEALREISWTELENSWRNEDGD